MLDPDSYTVRKLRPDEPERFIKSSAEFVAGFVPPDYLIDHLLQRRFCYSFTGATGAGKTTVTLHIAASIALGRSFGGRGVEKGRVLFLAGENPDDIRMRWIALSETMGFDLDTIPVHFIPGVFKIGEMAERISREAEQLGGVVLVVVDTSAAYYPGSEENSNVQMGEHARQLRELTTLPGGPCVIINCHPVKNPGPDNLLPRGGGAFVAEVDGNLTCTKNDVLMTVHWQGKFRGPDFEPIILETRTVTVDRLRDSKGRLIPTVVAQVISETERQSKAADTRSDEDALLVALLVFDDGTASGAAVARHLGWFKSNGEPSRHRAKRVADRLKQGRFLKDERGALVLTDKGRKAAIKAREIRAAMSSAS
jgi:hypothetical protein